MQWLKLLAWKVGDRGFEPHSCIPVSKKQNVSSPFTRKCSILCGEVACSVSDRQGSNFEFCVWRAVSSHSSQHHDQEIILAQFSLHVHKCGLKPNSFHIAKRLGFYIGLMLVYNVHCEISLSAKIIFKSA